MNAPAERPLTPAAKRQSWAEPAVRLPTVVTVVVLIALVGLIVKGVRDGRAEREAVRTGVRVDARITELQGSRIPKGLARTQPLRVAMRAKLPDRPDEVELSGILPTGPGSVGVDTKLPVLVDPKTLRWTDRIEPRPWAQLLTVPAALLPLVAVTAAWAAVARRRVLALWRTGEPRRAVVGDVVRSALSPGSRLMRVTLADGDERRVFGVVRPDRLGVVQPGDEVELICDPANPTRAILAAAYE